VILEEFFQSEKIPSAVKWVVTLVVTGFIAQFGKRLADLIIQKVRARRKEKQRSRAMVPRPEASEDGSAPVTVPASPDKKAIKTDQKNLKKWRKARAKAEKKKTKDSG